MPTYNYVYSSNSIQSPLPNGSQFNVQWPSINNGPATLSINGGPAYPVVSNSLAPLVGGELTGISIVLFNTNKFIILGSSPITIPTLESNQTNGGYNVNLIPDPLFQRGSIYWDYSRAGGTITTAQNLPPNGVTGLQYLGNGSPSGSQVVTSAYIAVNSLTNYCLSGYIDATHVTGTNYPAWVLKSTDLVTTYATAAQTSGIAGIVTTAFQFPNGVSQAVCQFITNNATVVSGQTIKATTPQLELGVSPSQFKTNYTKQSTIGAFPSMFGAWTNAQLNGSTPSSASGGGITFYGGGTGSDTWVASGYSGNIGLQVQTVSGGTVVSNSNLGIQYTVTGAEVFSFFAQITDNTPEQIEIRLYNGTSYSNPVYWGVDKFAIANATGSGVIPTSTNVWAQFAFTAVEVGLTAGAAVSGISWGVYKTSGTSTVIFSDFTSSDIASVPNLFIDTGGVNNDAITAPTLASLSVPIFSGGNLSSWTTNSPYTVNQIIIDANGNGELATSAFTVDAPGLVEPSMLVGHYLFLPSGATTPSNIKASLSSGTANAATLITPVNAVAPYNVFPTIADVEVNSASNVNGFSISSGSPVSGQVMVIQVAADNSAGAPTISTPAGWFHTNEISGHLTLDVYTKIAGSSEPSSYSFTFGLTGSNYNAVLTTMDFSSGTGVPVGAIGSGVSNINAPSILSSANPYTMYIVGFAFQSLNTIVAPPSLSASSPFTWPTGITALTQDNVLIWENIGPAAPYEEWLTIASINVSINKSTDIVDLFVDNTLYTISNMALGDEVMIRFITGTTVLAQGVAAISTSTTSATSSAQGSGVLIHKRATGLVGAHTITAQFRIINGSGNGIFAVAIEQADVSAIDYKK